MDKIEKLQAAVKEHGFWGTISVLDENNSSIFEESFGYADLSNERLNNNDTRYGIASGTKLFTALATLIVCTEHNVPLDAYVSDILDDSFYYDNKVTIRHLLSHSSGIPCYCDEDAGVDYAALWHNLPVYMMKEQKDFLQLFPKENIADLSKFKPGQGFHYNNSAFIYLALIIEELSGRKFQEFVTEKVLNTAGIKQSGFYIQGQLPENCATAYEIDENDTMKSNMFSVPLIGGGDGGMFACAKDIHLIWKAIFTRLFVEKGLISSSLQDEMLRIQNSESDCIHYGLGVWIYKEPEGNPIYYIVGADPGVAFTSKYNPETGNSAVLLANTEDPLWKVSSYIDSLL